MDNSIKIWDLDSKKEITTIQDNSWVLKCFFTPNGKQIVTSQHSASVKIWDADSGVHIRTLSNFTDAVYSCSLSPNGKWICAVSRSGNMLIYDFDGNMYFNIEGIDGFACDIGVNDIFCTFTESSRNLIIGKIIKAD